MNSEQIIETRLYTRREVADFGFRSYDALAADAVKRIGIPLHKFGSSVRYLGADILAYIEAARVETDST